MLWPEAFVLCGQDKEKKLCVAKKKLCVVQLAVSSFTPARACEKPDAKVRCWVRSEKQKQLLSFTWLAELCGVPGGNKNVPRRCTVASVGKSVQSAKPFQSRSSQSFASQRRSCSRQC